MTYVPIVNDIHRYHIAFNLTINQMAKIKQFFLHTIEALGAQSKIKSLIPTKC